MDGGSTGKGRGKGQKPSNSLFLNVYFNKSCYDVFCAFSAGWDRGICYGEYSEIV